MFCTNCGKKIPDDSMFCPFCGVKTTAVKDDTNMNDDKNVKDDRNTNDVRNTQHSPKIKKSWIFAVAAVILVIILTIAFSLHGSKQGAANGKTANGGIAAITEKTKNNGMTIAIQGDKLVLLKDTPSGNTDICEVCDLGSIDDMALALYRYCHISSDGRFLYFSKPSEANNLYAVKISELKAGEDNSEHVKLICSNIYNNLISGVSEGKNEDIFYLDTDNVLCRYDGKNIVQIADTQIGGSKWYDSVSDALLFYNNNKCLQVVKNQEGAEPITIDRGVTRILNKDTDNIIYVKENCTGSDAGWDIYHSDAEGNVEPIVQGARFYTYFSVDSGSFVYVTEEDEQVSMYDFIDEQGTGSGSGYQETGTGDSQMEYYDDGEGSIPLTDSDIQELKDTPVVIPHYKICRYSNGVSRTICDDVESIPHMDSDMVIYKKAQGDYPKICGLNEIYNMESFTGAVSTLLDTKKMIFADNDKMAGYLNQSFYNIDAARVLAVGGENCGDATNTQDGTDFYVIFGDGQEQFVKSDKSLSD